jgi:hypothetical protein
MAEFAIKRGPATQMNRSLSEAPGLMESISSPPSSRFDSPRAKEAVKAAWMMRDATDAEVRKAFESMTVAEGLSLLAQARTHIETAATILNRRIGEEAENEVCSSCGEQLPPGRMWTMQGSELDKETGCFVPYRYCSMSCVRDRNRKKMNYKVPGSAPETQVDGTPFGSIK